MVPIMLAYILAMFGSSKASGCDFTFNSIVGNFSSLGYPSKYLANKQCSYAITAPAGKTIQLNFLSFNLGQLGCSYAEFKIYEGTSARDKLVLTKCGNSRDPFISQGNRLFIVFKAVYMISPGFVIRYAVRDGCNMILDTNEGTITSPNFPLNYPDSTICSYKISGPPGSKIHLIFSRLRLESSSLCTKDRLSIYEGGNAIGAAASVKCGTNTTQYLSSGSNLFLQFTSDSSVNEEGFRIFFVTGKQGCDQSFTAKDGNITSPSFPSNYPNNARCVYRIRVPAGNLIQLVFRSFSLPGYGDLDRLKIYEGHDEYGLLADSRTWAINYPYLSKGNNLFLVFQTDATGTSSGFDFKYKTLKGCSIHFTSLNGMFSSPLYPHSYGNNSICNYTITVQPGKRVHLYFQKFDLEYEESCAYDRIQIYEGSGLNGTLAETLCGMIKNKQFISAGNQLFLQFKTNERISRPGFLANYYTTQLNCDSSYSAKSGVIQSQNFPNNYPNNARCTYQIRGKSGEKIQLMFSTFSMQDSIGCNADSMKIYEERISESTLITTRCGNKTTGLVSTASRLYLVFTTDMSKTAKGYQIYYQVGPQGCGGVFNAASGVITSPMISSKYPNNAECKYKIIGKTGQRISIIFSSFSLQYHESCKFDSLKIYEGVSEGNGTLAATRCGSDATPILSTTNQMLLVFKTDAADTMAGFHIYYYVDDLGCNKKIAASSGTITSPSSPSPYPNNAFCTYLIEVAADQRIQLDFQTFMLQSCCSPTGCDTLNIYDGADSKTTLLRVMCGTTHSPLMSSTNKLFIEFKSDGSIPNYGFKANFLTKGPGICLKQKPCRNNGTCIDVAGDSYECNCLSEYTGANCTTRFIPCLSSPCLNGGVCKNRYHSDSAKFECICKDGFTGMTCQSKFEECLDYKVDRRWQRSMGNKVNTSSSALYCDNSLASGWYRFISKAGSEMPTSCPVLNSCGTSGSIWANGTLPRNIGDYATVKACVRNKIHCCSSLWDLRMKKCRGNGTIFHVYQLIKPPSCPMAYCAGTEVPCPDGWNSPTGFTPGCTNNFPKITSKPKISPGVKSNRLQFKCEFESDAKEDTAMFEVTWYEGSLMKKINQTNLLKGTERIATLQNKQRNQEKPLFRLGTTIFCRVRSWYKSNAYTINAGPSYESNRYFAGIKVEPRQTNYTISERSKPLKLMVTATVPIVCSDGNTCKVVVDLGQDNSEGFLNLCRIEFLPGPANQIRVIEVVAKRDFVIDGNKTMIIRIKVLVGIDPADWKDHHKVTEVVIIIIDIHTERCTSSGDPHLITFDKLYFNHYKIGDYVLVNSTCRIFEVHVRTRQCAAVTCNCGVAVREGKDVIVVDMCRDGVPRARFASKTKPADGTSIKRDETGKSFIITFPSGAFIRMDNYRWYGNTYYANVVVQVPSDDFNCTVGLCGTFDRNRHNDMRSKDGKMYTAMDVGSQGPVGFTESWKIAVGKSLFYYKENEGSCKKNPVKRHCTCKYKSNGPSEVKCDYKTIAKRPYYLQGRQGWRELGPSVTKKCEKRKRRAMDQSIDLPTADDEDLYYVYDPPQLNVTIPKWPTKSGKEKAAVEAYCNNKVKNSDSGKICSVIPNFDFLSYVDQCIEDIKITDNYSFSTSAVRSMQDACEEIFLKNTTYWKQDSSKNGTFAPPTNIAKTLCPGLCSGYGRCVDGTCVCNANYTSADCSIDKNNGPRVISAASNGLCDVRKRKECNIIRIIGYDFIETDKLACRATKIQVTSNGYSKTKEHGLHTAVLLSFAEIFCRISNHSVQIDEDAKVSSGTPFDAYLIQVTNDGTVFSKNPVIYMIHDSKCMQCNSSTVVCKVKANTCNINGYCYTSGEVSKTDKCSKCNPSTSQTTFSKDASCETKSNLVVIIVSSVVGLAVIIALVAIVIFKQKKAQSRIIKLEAKSAVDQQFENSAYEGSS